LDLVEFEVEELNLIHKNSRFSEIWNCRIEDWVKFDMETQNLSHNNSRLDKIHYKKEKFNQ
jgi:hypothetical protein